MENINYGFWSDDLFIILDTTTRIQPNYLQMTHHQKLNGLQNSVVEDKRLMTMLAQVLHVSLLSQAISNTVREVILEDLHVAHTDFQDHLSVGKLYRCLWFPYN